METLVHAKQKEALPAWCDDLKGLYSRHIPACCWFISQLIENHWAEDVLLYEPRARARVRVCCNRGRG